ncbi:hypothetical protein I4U23_005322 [Adineta vaga]|nr:hypothetical protein I4U23_005322 [Adineta vaga]
MDVQITETSLSKLDKLTEAVVDQTSEVNPSSNTPEKKSQQENITTNTNAHFGLSCNRILSETEIVKNIIERSKIQDRRRWLYLLVVCIPLLITMGSVMIKRVVMNSNDDCDTSKILLTVVILLSIAEGFVLILVIYCDAKHHCNGKNYEVLRSSINIAKSHIAEYPKRLQTIVDNDCDAITKYSISRCVCIQLFILLGLLILKNYVSFPIGVHQASAYTA